MAAPTATPLISARGISKAFAGVEVGEDQGDCFLVMDFVNGTDIKHLIAHATRLPERLFRSSGWRDSGWAS